jgi:hypothetical protein
MEEEQWIWYTEGKESVQVRFSYNSSQGIRRYRLDLVGVQVSWDCKNRRLYFFCGKRNENRQLGKGFSVHHRAVSAVRTELELVSDRMSYLVLRGGWCNIIVLNVQTPSERKRNDSKDSSNEELEQVFDHFPKYYMKLLLADFNTKLV